MTDIERKLGMTIPEAIEHLRGQMTLHILAEQDLGHGDPDVSRLSLFLSDDWSDDEIRSLAREFDMAASQVEPLPLTAFALYRRMLYVLTPTL